MYTKSENDEKLNVAAFDHWSADTRQDAQFTVSSLHAVFDVMPKKPEWVTFISDNGIEVRKWIFLEAGEAKTAIDSHHAQVRFNRIISIRKNNI